MINRICSPVTSFQHICFSLWGVRPAAGSRTLQRVWTCVWGAAVKCRKSSVHHSQRVPRSYSEGGASSHLRASAARWFLSSSLPIIDWTSPQKHLWSERYDVLLALRSNQPQYLQLITGGRSSHHRGFVGEWINYWGDARLLLNQWFQNFVKDINHSSCSSADRETFTFIDHIWKVVYGNKCNFFLKIFTL